MNRIQKLLCGAGSAALGLGVAPNASARSATAWSGAPNPLTARSCFSESYGRVTNSGCSTQETWEIALPIENPGTWNVVFDVTPTSDPSSISCVALSVAQDGSSSATSLNVGATQGSAAQTIAVTVTVPAAGALFGACFVKPGAAVNGVNWNQPLLVALDPQLESNWCWAAGGQMVMGYLGTTVQQCVEANYNVSRTDCCTNPSSSACNQGGWPAWSNNGFNATVVYGGGSNPAAISFAQLQAEFAANRPVGFGWHWNSGGGHYMVATGTEVDEDNVQYVTFNDPWAPNVGEQVTLTYAEWVSGTATDPTVGGASYTHWRDDYGISKQN